MRQDLVDWMSQQHSTLELVDETLHLAIRYLDTFLNRRGAHPPRPHRAPSCALAPAPATTPSGAHCPPGRSPWRRL